MNAVNNSFDIKRNTPVDMESLGIILPENLKGKYSIKGFLMTINFQSISRNLMRSMCLNLHSESMY